MGRNKRQGRFGNGGGGCRGETKRKESGGRGWFATERLLDIGARVAGLTPVSNPHSHIDAWREQEVCTHTRVIKAVAPQRRYGPSAHKVQHFAARDVQCSRRAGVGTVMC